MKLGEAILLRLSRAPSRVDYVTEELDQDNPLCLFTANFPRFLDTVAGKRIVDFGCGKGVQSRALIAAGAAKVLGVDQNPLMVEEARAANGASDRVEFGLRTEERHRGAFDMVIAQNSMEHFHDPAAVLAEMKTLLGPDGRIFLTFGPPWCAPYGAHMHFFTRVPWVNLLFSEATVMNVRHKFRDDELMTYEAAGLNRLTIARFEKIIRQCGMRVVFKRYDCVKRLTWLGKVPLLRELLINHVSCELA